MYPAQHRRDRLSAAIHPLDAERRAQARERYRLLMVHYGLEATTNNLGLWAPHWRLTQRFWTRVANAPPLRRTA